MNNHPTQINEDGTWRPLFPNASHFSEWPYVGTATVEKQQGDLYYNFVSESGNLLIGFQTSAVDGDYLSPHIDGKALRKLDTMTEDYADIYLRVCQHAGIPPTYTEG
jgi:hypothetical protein